MSKRNSDIPTPHVAGHWEFCCSSVYTVSPDSKYIDNSFLTPKQRPIFFLGYYFLLKGFAACFKFSCSYKNKSGPLANWPWLRISPQSSLYVIYCLILIACQWLMSFTCIPVQIGPIKTHWEKGSWPFSFERSATSPPQAKKPPTKQNKQTKNKSKW